VSNRFSTAPIEAVTCLVRHRDLVRELVIRDFIGRYKGSVMGAAWAFFHPLLMLAVYTVVFGVAFKAKWAGAGESRVAFALVLFSGMIVHGLLADCLNRAPTLITTQPNFVRKVVFPLEILPWVIFLSTGLHFLVGLAILVLACLATGADLHAGIFLLPLILLPLALLAMGLTWLLSSLGVYLRDLAQGMSVVTTVLLFVSPAFYPIDGLPPSFRTLVSMNPITLPIIQLRQAMLWGSPLDWLAWAASLLVGLLVFYAGFWWFQRSRKGFADVL
jgi:lipopolysaccharide transport system permease protein